MQRNNGIVSFNPDQVRRPVVPSIFGRLRWSGRCRFGSTLFVSFAPLQLDYVGLVVKHGPSCVRCFGETMGRPGVCSWADARSLQVSNFGWNWDFFLNESKVRLCVCASLCRVGRTGLGHARSLRWLRANRRDQTPKFVIDQPDTQGIFILENPYIKVRELCFLCGVVP